MKKNPSTAESIPAEGRAAWHELLSAALNGSRDVNDAAVARAEVALTRYEYERAVVRSYTRAGLRRDLNNISKAESVALVAHNGSHVAKTTRLGTRRRRDDGTYESQQVLIHDMTWEELGNWLLMIETQIGALLVNQAMAKKLLILREEYPESIGPKDACVAKGTTIEEYLAA